MRGKNGDQIHQAVQLQRAASAWRQEHGLAAAVGAAVARHDGDSVMGTELQQKLGTTFTDGQWTVRLDVAHDDDASTDDAECYTPRQIAAWRNGDWEYVGVIASVRVDGIELGVASLWGIERGWMPMTDEDDNLTADPVEYLDVYDEAIQGVIDDAKYSARVKLSELLSHALEVLS